MNYETRLALEVLDWRQRAERAEGLRAADEASWKRLYGELLERAERAEAKVAAARSVAKMMRERKDQAEADLEEERASAAEESDRLRQLLDNAEAEVERLREVCGRLEEVEMVEADEYERACDEVERLRGQLLASITEHGAARQRAERAESLADRLAEALHDRLEMRDPALAWAALAEWEEARRG